MRKQIKWTLFFLLLIVFTITSALFAAEVQSGKAQTQPVTIQKLPQIIKIDKNIALRKKQDDKYISQGFNDAWKKVTDIYNLLHNKMVALEQARQKYYIKSDACVNKSYTPSDQQAAGCVGSDTIDLCYWKLFDKCIQPEDKNYSNACNEFDYTKQQMKNAVNALQ